MTEKKQASYSFEILREPKHAQKGCDYLGMCYYSGCDYLEAPQ